MFLFEEKERERMCVCVCVCRRDRYVERKVAIRTDKSQILSFQNKFTRIDTEIHSWPLVSRK